MIPADSWLSSLRGGVVERKHNDLPQKYKEVKVMKNSANFLLDVALFLFSTYGVPVLQAVYAMFPTLFFHIVVGMFGIIFLVWKQYLNK